MPPLIPAGGALAAFLGTTLIGTITVGSLLSTVALSGLSFLIQAALAPNVGAQNGIDPGVKQTVKADIYEERLIYGRALVGGRMILEECKPPYLVYGLEIASHEIDEIEAILVNGKTVTFDAFGNANSLNFNNGTTAYISRSIRKGTSTQTLDPLLASTFPEFVGPASYRQRGHAVVVFKFYYGADATDHEKYWGSQFPQVLFLVRGKKLFDPRDASQSVSDATTWKWSNTPSLCQADFMTSSDGMNRPWSTIDLATLKAAADDDDRRIALASGVFEKRYSLDGVVNPNEPAGNVLQNMLTANIGKIIWSNGVYKFLSGVARNPVLTLNDDSARGSMQVRAHRDRAGLLNVVRTIFVSLDREYQTVNGPVLSNATYITADGESHEGSITLPFTTSQTTAQRIARVTMEHARKGKQITRREDINALRLEASDIVNIEIPHLPVLGGVFELNKIKLDHESFEIEIEAEEYDKAQYDWLVAYEQSFTLAPLDLAGVN